MANNDKENKIKKFTKEAIGKTLNQFNKEIGIADLVEVNKNQDRILNGILSQVNDESTEKTEKSNVIMLDNSTDGIVELKEIQGDTNVNVSKIVEETPITHVIEDKEGNVISLDDITEGAINIDNIQGNTMVNCNKEADKELILMEDLSTEGYSNITLNKGVDGGLVDVALEGNTMVNVCDQKDPVAITKSYTVETGNHVALQGEYDGKCRPVVTGNTLWIDNATEEVLTAFDNTKNLRLQSSFEDKVVTQEMVDAGEEIAENLGKYKVDYVVTGRNKFDNDLLIEGVTLSDINGTETTGVKEYKATKEYISVTPGANLRLSLNAGEFVNLNIICFYDNEYNFISSIKDSYTHNQIVVPQNAKYLRLRVATQATDVQLEEGTTATEYEPYKEYKKTFYLNSPLLEGDTIEQQGDNVVHVHRSELRAYETGDELTLPTDMTNTLVSKPSPQYEVISQNDTILCDSYVNGHLDVDSVVPIEKVDFLHFEKDLTYLYANTQYAVQFVSNAVSKVDITLGGAKLLNQNVVAGINKYMITTPSGLVDNKLVVSGVGLNVEKVVVTNTDRDFGYFEGMKSVGECEDLKVVSCNKNLYNLTENDWVNYGYFKPDGTLAVWNGYYYTPDYINISVLRGKQVYIQLSGGEYTKVVMYDKSKNLIKFEETAGVSDIVINFPENGYYIRLSTGKTGYQSEGNMICEEGDRAYIPHQSNTQTLTHEPLRAVGDIKDKYVLIDGKWYIERNCAEVVLDGSADETWTTGMSNAYYSFDDLSRESDYTDNIICNYLKTSRYHSSDIMEVNSITGYYDLNKYPGKNWIYLKLNDSINDYKAWLQSNPLTVIYKKAQPTYEPVEISPVLNTYTDVTHISNNSTIPCNMTIKNTGYNCLLKPSTTYTVSSNLGLNTVTTPSTLTEDCLRFYDTDTSTVTTMKDVTILEGDYTSKANSIPANFSGIKSAFEQEYDEEKGKYKVKAKVVGKNLFNGEWHNGWLSISNGNILPSNNYKYCDYIRVPSNAKIRVKCSFDIPEYDYNKNFIKNNGGGRTTITTSSNCYYIRIDVRNPQDISNYQVEEGTEATPYEPYKENYIEFYIDEPLRGIGNVKDEVYIKNDKVVVERNCGSVTFDGSDDENWIMMNNNTNFIRFDIEHPNVSKVAIAKELIKSNTFNYGKDENCITNHSTLSKFIIFINKNKLLTQDILGFKQWLQQNPTTVVYQLAEPTYEEVEYSESRLFLNTYNNSTLFYESNIPVSNTSFKPLWEELVYIKNSTKYYIQFNAVGSGEVVINLGGTELTTEIVEGYNCIPITTPSESTNLMTISGQGITISEVVVSEVICGGHYKGLQSCFEEHMENGKYRVLLRGIALDGSKVNGIKLYINEPLRGIGNIKDRLCIKNGKLVVERRCGEIVFDGSDDEIWDILSFNFVNHTKATTKNIPNLKGTDNYRLANSYCDKFIQLTESPNFGNDTQEYYAIGTTSIEISINNSKLSSPNNVNGIKKWLQQNPTKIIYELKNPVYEEVTNEYGLPIVFEGYENGIVYIDSAVTPTTHIKYTSNNQLATTLAEAEEQNIATQEDINMNVITYMMDIDMMLTDMEMSNDISVMAVRRDNSNENMLDRMSDEDKKVYRDNTVVMLEKMITANVLEKEDIEGRINIYYDKNRISKEQYKYLKSLL